MRSDFYDNIGISALAINFVLRHQPNIDIAKVYLILPFLLHKSSITLISKIKTEKSIDEFVATYPAIAANFHSHFTSYLALTTNTLLFLHDIGLIKINGRKINQLKTIDYEKKMGKRANEIFKVSYQLSKILDSSSDDLYTHLRIWL